MLLSKFCSHGIGLHQARLKIWLNTYRSRFLTPASDIHCGVSQVLNIPGFLWGVSCILQEKQIVAEGVGNFKPQH